MHKIIYYCKSLKKTGKPIVVYDCDTKKTRYTNKFNLTNCTVKMEFNNSKGKAKRRGATTVLDVKKRW